MQEEVAIINALRAILADPPTSRTGAERASRAAELLAELYGLAERVRELEADVAGEVASDGGDLAGLTLHEAARRVLSDAGQPLHARELGRRIKARGWRHPRSKAARPDQIVFQLAARLPRHPETFKRVSRNTFALDGWDTPDAEGRPRPRVPLFHGPGTSIARETGDASAPVVEGPPWRSS